MSLSKSAFHFSVVSGLAVLAVYLAVPDRKESTAQLLENRPDVKRARAQQADIVRRIKDTSGETDKILDDLSKRGIQNQTNERAARVPQTQVGENPSKSDCS